MSYQINFDSRTSAEELARVVIERYGIERRFVFVGDSAALDNHEGPAPQVWIAPAPAGDELFACELQAGEALEAMTHDLSERDLATVLCRELHTRALVDDGGSASQVWTLVTADGWHGRVVLDEDALDINQMKILYAYQAVPSEPGIRVQEPPAWQSGWYEDGEIPA